MNELISRQKLKPCPFCGGEAVISVDTDAITDTEGRVWAYTAVCNKCAASSGLTFTVEKAIEVWNKRVDQPPADQWIPCSERLPDESGRYLIQGINSYDGNPYFAIVHINVWNEKRKCWLFDGKPIAWMPLPEPYKGAE
ncbi:MAG: Lar family restriction alleviation protein [Firmicutes bacterium]|nr:Lar family restriction alleviation protein [Bacillota bacterium]